MLIAVPGLPQGQTVAIPVEFVDLAPTLFAVAGLSTMPDLDGKSLLGLLQDNSTAGDHEDWVALSQYPAVHRVRESDPFVMGASMRTLAIRFTAWCTYDYVQFVPDFDRCRAFEVSRLAHVSMRRGVGGHTIRRDYKCEHCHALHAMRGSGGRLCQGRKRSCQMVVAWVVVVVVVASAARVDTYTHDENSADLSLPCNTTALQLHGHLCELCGRLRPHQSCGRASKRRAGATVASQTSTCLESKLATQQLHSVS
jgi:hypothetical protein